MTSNSTPPEEGQMSAAEKSKVANYFWALVGLMCLYVYFNPAKTSEPKSGPEPQGTQIPANKPSAPEVSLEKNLAFADYKDDAFSDAIRLKRYRFLLDTLDGACVENAEQIAKMSFFNRDELEKVGVSDKILQMMETINRALPAGTGHDYATWVSAYYSARKNGRTVEETENLLPALVAASNNAS